MEKFRIQTKEKLYKESNIMKSIRGCVDVQRLVEEQGYKYRKAVSEVIKKDRSIFTIDNGFKIY